MNYRVPLALLAIVYCVPTAAAEKVVLQRYKYNDSSAYTLMGWRLGWRDKWHKTRILKKGETDQLIERCKGTPPDEVEEVTTQKRIRSRQQSWERDRKRRQASAPAVQPPPEEDPNLFVYRDIDSHLWGRLECQNTYLFDVTWLDTDSPNCLRIINMTNETLFIDPSIDAFNLSAERTLYGVPNGTERLIPIPPSPRLTIWRKQKDREKMAELTIPVRLVTGARTVSLRRRGKSIRAELQGRQKDEQTE